jgi:uncharacterized protein YggE
MRSVLLGVLLLALESLAFGQLDSDTLTVSASQPVNLQPDQLIFSIYVTTAASTGLDEVAAGFKSAGITTAIFSDVSSSRDHATLTWFFNLAVPFSKIPATVAQLTAQKVEFYVQGSQVSAASQQAQQCPLATMIADARAQAKKLADAAELVVGEILSLSSGQPLNGAQAPYVQQQQSSPPQAALGGTVFAVSLVQIPIQPAVSRTCSLTVKFKLLRYKY